ncbi:SIS domain-containing protein [Dongshaea marina]|uniref:SIS domain-containing protein n=1 Tax=Dongshaea marina TaxID=2047966 RepID=UPI000D3E11C2|nr:SIS domain-containing protein [Dongshaea marina]
MSELLGYSRQWLENHGAIHTATEISQQPELWRQLARDLAENRDIEAFLRPVLQHDQLRVILTGAGTSAFAGRALAPWLNQNSKLQVEAIATTDIVANPSQYLSCERPTLLVSFARSGNSPESVAAVALADQLLDGCHHLVLTCNPQGELSNYAERSANACRVLMPDGSNDKSFAMTSSFSCMLVAALLLLDGGDVSQSASELSAVAEICEQKLLEWQQAVRELASKDFKRLIYLGSGPLQGLAEEASLKMLELSAGQVMTRHDSTLGFRHGPKFALGSDGVAILFASADQQTRRYDRDLFSELHDDDLAMQVIALCGADPLGSHCLSLECPQLRDGWLIFPYILFAQMLAFEKSLALGLTPDNPCPTGEVNRVVQGVTIYPYIA